MNTTENDPTSPDSAPGSEYEPPAIAESAAFDSLVAACAYGPDDGGGCAIDPSQPQ
tara:strand:- start:66 stop:233 length:168 start_codon:yes stop_codon:yes gene_type:complete